MNVRFRSKANERVRSIGPAQWLEMRGARLVAGPDYGKVAEHRRRHWVVDGYSYEELAIPQAAKVVITAGGEEHLFGPFSQVRAWNGCLYGDERFLARLDEAVGAWSVVPLSQVAEMIVIVPLH